MFQVPLTLLKPNESDVESWVNLFLSNVSSHSRLYVAYSGGLDSTVLLHSIYSSSIRADKNITIVAIYVDHGLQEDSSTWQNHCSVFCQHRCIDFIGLQIAVENTARKGVEAEARRLRYQAILKSIDDSKALLVNDEVYLLTGHHQKDQAETVLLNLFRGAGVNGLAGMPFNKTLFTPGWLQVQHVRPMIHVGYDEIVAYADKHNLTFVTDKSNFQTDYKRNSVRHNVLPVLENVWPHAIDALSRTGQHMQEALLLLDCYAEESLQAIPSSCYFLDLQSVTEMPWFKVKNIIRYWFKTHWPQITLSEIHYQWIEQSLAQFANSLNHNFKYQLSTGCLRVYQSRLYFLKNEPATFSVQLSTLGDAAFLPSLDGSSLSFKVNWLEESFNGVVRSISPLDAVKRKNLKRFFQQNKVPIWERLVWPVLEVDGVVVSVLGCEDCLCAEAQKKSGGNPSTIIKIDYNQLLKWWAVFS
ncbi:MAG: tRNA lysidine(34) synthetase TilS [Thiomicrorhabdus sp.]|nr:tRNA lysidine(34) synthetase TilS [Thiomicrorhabdus sp.]